MSDAMQAGAGAETSVQGTQAIGPLVKLEPSGFLQILSRQERPLVVHSEERFFLVLRFNYLTSYKGLTFFASSQAPLTLPNNAETIKAKSIWGPHG